MYPVMGHSTGRFLCAYEHGLFPTGEGVSGRAPLQPPTELATLDDYRGRHRLFRTDAALVEMMRRAPIIAIWSVIPRRMHCNRGNVLHCMRDL